MRFILGASVLLGMTACDIAVRDDAAPREMEIHLSADGECRTRTSLGEGNAVLWQEGECISVFDGSSSREFSLISGAGTEKAVFSGTVSGTASELYALSPRLGSEALDGSTISGIAFPAYQNATAGSFDPMAAVMVAHSDELESLHFRHVAAYVKFSLDFDCSSVEFASGDGSALAGVLSVGVEDDGRPASVRVTADASSSVFLTGDMVAGQQYLLGVLPAALNEGFTIRFSTDDGSRYTRIKSGPVSMESGHILNLGTLSAAGTWDKVEPERSVSLSRHDLGIMQGDSFQLNAVTTPSSASLEWVSTDASVASVNGSVVTALKAGSCSVVVRMGTLADTCHVSVIASPSAVYRHGYSELSAVEKKAYEHMVSRIAQFESNGAQYNDVISNRVYLDFASVGYYPQSSDVMRLTNVIIKDYPEFFHITNYIWRYDYDRYQYYVRLTRTYTPEIYSDYMSAVYEQRDALMEGFPYGGSDFDKAKHLHDALGRSARYGDMTGAHAGDIVGGLINKRVVCEGFARTYLFLCQQAGLKAIYVAGALQTSEETDTWVNHAWNHVKVGDSWYMCDLTSDCGLVGAFGYRYFLLGQTSATRIHSYLNVEGGDPNTDSIGYKSLPALSTSDYSMTR